MRVVITVVVLIAFYVCRASPYHRIVRDHSGVNWEEYYDEVTEHFYYHNSLTGKTSWMINAASKAQSIEPNITSSFMQHVQIHGSKGSSVASLFNRQSKTISNPLVPGDRASLGELIDVAGYVRLYPFLTLFDMLPGVQARESFGMSLKSPISFHHMFYDVKARRLSIADERARLEADILRNSSDVGAWTLLGHVWRVATYVSM